MFNGFGSVAAFYSYFARRLATWGYAVVQYDNLMLTTDRQEITYLGYIKSALKGQPGLAGVLDWNSQAVAGHSRGGKLAALHLAQVSSILHHAWCLPCLAPP